MTAKLASEDGADQPPKLADYMTMQGVAQVTDASSSFIRRTVWFVIICGGLGFTAFNIYKQTTLYLRGPISVSIDVKLAKTLTFPTITVCDTNLVKKSASDALNLTRLLKQVFRYSFQEVGAPGMSDDDMGSIADTSFNDLALKTGSSFNDSLIKCDWREKTCSPEDLTSTITDSGPCFTFNARGHLQVKGPGRMYGLRLQLDAQSEEFTRSRKATEGPGYLIAVHSSGVPPAMYAVGMTVTPGSQYYLGLELTEVNSPPGLRNCGSASLKYYNTSYSIEACRAECLIDYIVKRCSCKELYMPGNASMCTPVESVKCSLPAADDYFNHDDECKLACPDSCSFSTYQIKSKSNLDPTDEYLATLGQHTNRSLSYWKRNYLSVDVYFRSMSYTFIEKRYAYSVLDLFCDIGGALGLVLGASMVTAVELVDYTVRCMMPQLGNKGRTHTIQVQPKA